VAPVPNDAALCSLTRDAASGRKRLNHRHTSFQAVLTGLLNLPVNIEHGRAIDIHGVAAVELNVIGRVSGRGHFDDIDVAPKGLAIAHAGYRHDFTAGRRHSPCRGEHSRDIVAGGIDGISTGLIDFANDGYQIPESLGQQHVYLRVDDESAVSEHLRDLSLCGRQGKALDQHRTDERITYGPGLRYPDVEAQVRILEHADFQDIARRQ